MTVCVFEREKDVSSMVLQVCVCVCDASVCVRERERERESICIQTTDPMILGRINIS